MPPEGAPRRARAPAPTGIQDITPAEAAALYRQFGIPQGPETVLAIKDSHLIEVEPLGRFNRAYAVSLQNSAGSRLDAVFKLLRSEDRSEAAWYSGIPSKHPRTAMRNLATLAYARKLNFDVICDMHLAAVSGTRFGRGPAKVLGLVMERAQGGTARETPPHVFRHPGVARELTKLQLLDHLTGQGDRHRENYFIDADATGAPKVTGIDNDVCFGKLLTEPDATKPPSPPLTRHHRVPADARQDPCLNCTPAQPGRAPQAAATSGRRAA